MMLRLIAKNVECKTPEIVVSLHSSLVTLYFEYAVQFCFRATRKTSEYWRQNAACQLLYPNIKVHTLQRKAKA